MSIEALIASTPKQNKSRSKSNKSAISCSPTLLAPTGNWVKYFDRLNIEQLHVLRARLDRIYQLIDFVEQQRQKEEAALWNLLSTKNDDESPR